MELAELVRHPRQSAFHGAPDRGLAVADHAALDRHPDRLRHLAQQRHEVVGGAGQQAAREQHLAREAVAHHPQHLVAHVRLQAVQGQDDPALAGQHAPQPREPRRGLPPLATRSRLAATFSNRPLRVRPEAASGRGRRR